MSHNAEAGTEETAIRGEYELADANGNAGFGQRQTCHHSNGIARARQHACTEEHNGLDS